MTTYICRCPHRLPATIWTADSEAQALALLNDENDGDHDDVRVAAADDMRDAYVTDDVLDLFAWIAFTPAAQESGAQRAFFTSREIRADVEALATLVDHPGDDDLYSAFEGRFIWSDDDGEWRLENQPPVEADDLFHAICDASLVLARRDDIEQQDV